MEFGIGVLAQGEVGVFDGEALLTLFNTSLPLPTACLSFDREAGTLGAVMATTTAAGKDATASETSAAEKGFRMGRMKVALALLLGVGVCFVGL